MSLAGRGGGRGGGVGGVGGVGGRGLPGLNAGGSCVTRSVVLRGGEHEHDAAPLERMRFDSPIRLGMILGKVREPNGMPACAPEIYLFQKLAYVQRPLVCFLPGWFWIDGGGVGGSTTGLSGDSMDNSSVIVATRVDRAT